MDPQLILIIFFGLVIIPSGYYIFNYVLPEQSPIKNLIANHDSNPIVSDSKVEAEPSLGLSNIQKVGSKTFTEHDNISSGLPPIEERLFRAGFMSKDQHIMFYLFQFIFPFVCASAIIFFVPADGVLENIFKTVLGIFIGVFVPRAWLDRLIANRDEEIMYYLPLVIEQFVIGVSSGLDIGPCINRVVSVADERDTHNPVTELLRNVLLLTRSGSSLDDALTEVGMLAGHTELKHSFMTMGQVSKHGGELSKQLQELANAVSSQRETKIEGRVKRLELHATGPVVLIFISFVGILFIGIGLQIMKALHV